MKKIITGAVLAVALLVGSIVKGQPPAPRGGTPPPPPAPGAPPRPQGPGGPGAGLQPVEVFKGRVTRFSANDDYIIDGFYLAMNEDSTLVKFPGRRATEITSLVKAGSTVTVNGTPENSPSGGIEVRMVSLLCNGQTIYDSPPATPPAPPSDTFVNGTGKIVGTQIDRGGRMNGLLLDNATVLRIPPETAAQLSDLAKNGVEVGYSGMQKTPQAGEVTAADTKVVHCNTISINGKQFLVR